MDEGVLIIVDGDVTKVVLETLMVDEEIEGVMEGVFEGVVLEYVVDFLEVVSEDGIFVDVVVSIAVKGDEEEGMIDSQCVVVEEIDIVDDEVTRVVEIVKSGGVETCFVIVTTETVSVLDVSLMRDVGLDAVGEVLVKAVEVEPISEVDELGIVEAVGIDVFNELE